ncbi:septum formation initiator family protein [Bacillus sp. FJAT-49736]|uniref:FtsB family cell division protein n=1 Tax=Bacillus sp. FJAT-49736 TaxID=2833582 RepID=UPI001BC9E376|nr:septum formation initiator family protein [Bacillus sp. FJAT-49736]MBS4175761.1 septum formation initiator family protein [Bacillus sp. FJAT-49736]
MGARIQKNITPMQNAYTKQQMMKEKVLARRKKLLFRRLIAFSFIALASVYLLVSTLITRNHQLAVKQEEKAKLTKSLAELRKEKSYLQDEVVKLNDDNYIAKLARSEYFLSEKGEIIFNIPEDKKKDDDKDVSY